ncbi:hypothetical protein [Rhodococcus aetherivorans]|uniref:hypothetical protein n=1 Tax=Rhodococcus aetherivorans TaxID=191292 RepID=UPI001E49D4E1|nr:hypothetical protein [Rhodococcus aetherivorans]UGQ42413.1 hypothetical protein LRQ66_03560 [Rhodococcus aetherivorans]
MVFGFLAGRIAERWSVHGALVVGLITVVAGAGGVLLTATATAHLPLAAMVVSLLTMVSGAAVTTPPSTSLALENHPEVAGSAASLLGLARFAFGGVTAPSSAWPARGPRYRWASSPSAQPCSASSATSCSADRHRTEGPAGQMLPQHTGVAGT